MKPISIGKYVSSMASVITIGILITIVAPSCKKTDPDCGCDSQTTETVTHLDGALNFYYSNKKEISIIVGPPGLATVFVICDTTNSILQSILKPKRDSVYSVTFSGNVKKFCPIDGMFYLDTRKVIQLTSIIPR